MSVILIGYRGSGKTSVGKALADRLAMTFVDGDDETRHRFDGKTIAQIWDESGEAEFRRVEAQVTTELCSRENCVIALGGGAVMHPDARAAVQRSDALCVYLSCDAPTLHARIQADTQTADSRPQLTTLGGSIDEIRHVLADREPTYRAAADLVLDASKRNPHQTADAIASHLSPQ